MNRTDQALVEAARRGDAGALEALLERHAPAIYRFGVKMCRDPEDAKDVLQETLIAAARGFRDFRGESSPATWLYAVARSFCAKRHRGSKFAPTSTVSLEEGGAADIPAAGPMPDEIAATRELAQVLDRELDSLEPSYREVLLLRDVEGLTAPEVAEVLGVTTDAVKSRLHRARAELRSRLEPRFPAEERLEQVGKRPDCPEIVAVFSRYLEGEIKPEECAEMDRHVASCDRCRAGCASLKHTLALCRTSSSSVPPAIQALVKAALRDLTNPPNSG
jgi:RNA polymerase sigma-70 factor (ECF subfamily)